ncbi:hypothetical protein D6D29_07967 [Aureobasidium pullulans]|nr:hypothetical protein D6D29_07967 [Aureobasidium pullulans]
MSDATWVPVFVTAKVPVELVNKILEHGEAQQRNDPDDLFPNRWVLVQDPEQSTFSTSTKPPVHSFTSGFVNASTESLKVFVVSKFGEQGLASNGRSDWIADDAFAVVDERTARDNSILFYVQQYVDTIRQAEVRKAWGKDITVDKLLLKYAGVDSNEMPSDEDVRKLAQELKNEKGSFVVDPELGDLEKVKAQLDSWLSKEMSEVRPVWMEVRLDAVNAVKFTIGIWHIGLDEALINHHDEFDEHGVMCR